MPLAPSHPQSVDSIKASIQKELTLVFDRCAGSPDGGPWWLEGPIHHRNHSQIFLLRHAREPSPLVVKWYCHDTDMSRAPEEAARQYHVMKSIHQELGNHGIFCC